MNNIHVFFLPEKISSKDRQCHMLVEPFCGLTNSPAVFFMSVKKALHISKQSLLVMTMVPSWVFRLLSTTTTFMTCSRSHRNPWILSTIRRSSYSFSNSFWDDHNNLMKFGASHLKTISRSLYLKLISTLNMVCMTSPHDERTTLSSGNSSQKTFSSKLINFSDLNILSSVFPSCILFVERIYAVHESWIIQKPFLQIGLYPTYWTFHIYTWRYLKSFSHTL